MRLSASKFSSENSREILFGKLLFFPVCESGRLTGFSETLSGLRQFDLSRATVQYVVIWFCRGIPPDDDNVPALLKTPRDAVAKFIRRDDRHFSLSGILILPDSELAGLVSLCLRFDGAGADLDACAVQIRDTYHDYTG